MARAMAAALVVLVLAVYAPVRGHGFVNFDDTQYVSENPHVVAGLTWPAVKWAFTTTHAGNWHPVTWLSHMLDVQLFGLDDGAHHVTNVVLHAANSLLLFWLWLRMTGALGRSAFVAALFAVHPLHVESVAWIAERKDVLSAFFGLLCLLAYQAYARDPRPWRYALVVMTLALALLSKPMLVTLPAVLLLLDWWPLERTGRTPLRRLVLEKVLLFALSAASSLATVLAQQQAGAVKALDALPLARRVANALLAYVGYVRQTLWPTGLAALYPYPSSIAAWTAAGALALLALVTFAALRERHTRPYLAVGWLWYVGMLVPVIGLVQVGSQPMADRYMYLPVVGLLVVLSWGIPELTTGLAVRRWLPAMAALGVAAYAGVARAQVAHWKDSIALWERALAVTHENARAHANLAHALSKQGRLADAVPHYEEALRLKPDFAEAHNNLGYALAAQGRNADAIAHYREAVRLLPAYHEALNNLGVALLAQGSLEDGLQALREALRLQPGLAQLRENLAHAYGARARAQADAGKLEAAIADQREVLRLSAGDADDHYDLAVLLYRNGQAAEAIREFEAALRLDPQHAQAQKALEALARSAAK